MKRLHPSRTIARSCERSCPSDFRQHRRWGAFAGARPLIRARPPARPPIRTTTQLAGVAALAALVLTLTLALTLTLGAATAPAAEPGVVLANTGVPHVRDLRALHVRWVRVFATWNDLEPTPGYYAPGWMYAYEKLFRELPRGTKVLVDVVGSAQWETGSADEHTPPANPEDYAAFVAGLAQRWGAKVAAYELWNEEDAPGWWTGAPDPTAYAALLKAAYPAIKAAEPNATVLLGGLTGNDYEFLEGLYKAGAKGYFDAVAVHTDTACNIVSPYSFLKGMNERMIPDSFLAYKEVHEVMLANGDPKPIWMTELSWRTTPAECGEGYWAGRKAQGVSEAQQATYLLQAYHCLAQTPYIPVAIWFPLQDEGAEVAGLLRADGTRKPSFAALADYASHGDRLSEPCGDFGGPAIDVAAPADRASYTGTLPIRVSAHDPEGVGRITLEINGKLIRNYTNQAFPRTLAGALHWHGAAHIHPGRNVLTFIAVDKLRNISRRSLVIYHVVHHHHHRR